jgi:hypothetical protein
MPFALNWPTLVAVRLCKQGQKTQQLNGMLLSTWCSHQAAFLVGHALHPHQLQLLLKKYHKQMPVLCVNDPQKNSWW